ncbi:MAG: hypothetical protein ABR974_00700 [Bacteroidales bacterium]|jgi:hypothetical protein
MLSLRLIPLQSNAASITKPYSSAAASPSEAKTLLLRLDEIKSMNKAELKSSEKRNLRKEVKSINHRIREIKGGVYISAGALITIIILLIILL